MNSTQVDQVTAHVRAPTNLLLGKKLMQPGMMIIAGEPLDVCARLTVSQMAIESQVDFVHLEFTVGASDAPMMTGINVFLPRDTICYTWTGCHLSLVSGRAHALIAPRDVVGDCFKVLPGEIVQIRGNPAGLTAWIERAATRIAGLVRAGVDVTGQVVMREYVDA